MKSYAEKKLRGAMLISLLLMSFIISGCPSIEQSKDYAANRRCTLKRGEMAPFDGMLLPWEDYDYFLKMENFAIQNGVLP